MKTCNICGAILEDGSLFCGECGSKQQVAPTTQTKCISCGNELEPGAKFCANCGAKQEEKKKFCAKCGAKLSPEAKFCMECGTTVADISVASQRPVAEIPSETVEPTSINFPDDDTVSIYYKGVTFNLKLVLGKNYGQQNEIPDFFIGETPVTQILWFATMGNNPSAKGSDPNFPVTNITHTMATAFMVKLFKELGIKFELPSKDQWSHAHDGGHKSKGFEYAGSDDINEVAWTDSILHPVGELFPNELGLVDMDGNIEELLKGNMQTLLTPDSNDNLNDEDFSGLRFVVNIPKEGFGADSPLAEFYSKVRPKIESHYSNEIKRLKQEAQEEEEKRLRQAEIDAKAYADPDTWEVEREDGKVGFKDPAGNWRIKPMFERFRSSLFNNGKFYDGLCLAKSDGKWGIIDTKGNWISKPEFDDIEDAPDVFRYGFMAVKKGNKWGYIKPDGGWLVAPMFDDIQTWHINYNIGGGKKGDTWYSVDPNGKLNEQEDYVEFILKWI